MKEKQKRRERNKMNFGEFHFCTCGKLAYIQRLNSFGIMEYLCLEHIDEKVREAIYADAEHIS